MSGYTRKRPTDAVGIRELKNQTSAIVARVARGGHYVVTHRGRAVAALVPLKSAAASQHQEHQAWEQLHALGRKVALDWASSQNGLDLLKEVRR